ncbi:hypothetical protein ACTMTJ_43715 [Phytohabitans sp. LJ34]|uniref:hypothetical protein n=1 Tax=Phytohabitans sp. LJ34 TaxID=3452217 RepID=UPI003F8AAC45
MPDPLVEALAPDPAAPPLDAVVLRGFLGPSTKKSEWRLYLNRTLNSYVIIPETRILHSQRLPDGDGTLVWVPRDLELKAVGPEPSKSSASFLGGSIAAGHLASATLNPLLMRSVIGEWDVPSITSGGFVYCDLNGGHGHPER